MGTGVLVKVGRDYFQLQHQNQRAGCGPRLSVISGIEGCTDKEAERAD